MENKKFELVAEASITFLGRKLFRMNLAERNARLKAYVKMRMEECRK